LLNRAISGMYAPGSTFKPLTAIAAIDSGVLQPDQIYFDAGVVVVDGQKFENVNGYGYGNINLEGAIAHSSNCYFHFFGMRTGIEAIDRMAALFGLGEKTGVELPGEISGVRANPDTKKQIWDDIWRPADTAQAAIGQISQAYTPLQLASYAAAIANDGIRFPPRIIRNVERPGGEKPVDFVRTVEPVHTGASAYALEQVRKGMLSACYMPYSYTEITFTPLPVKVAVKTGTAETGELDHSSNAIFIGIAPADKPEIAVAVVIQRGVWGAYCAPVAAAIIKEYAGMKVEASGTRTAAPDTTVFLP
jgi:penicillin-binding protein 2